MNNALDDLLREPRIWRAGDNHSPQDCVPSGFSELDNALPAGGWPLGALTEILHEHAGIGELRLVMPALARLSRAGRWIALVAPPHIPYAPALAAQGVDLSRILLVHPRADSDTLWALEQAMRSGSCAAVLAWPRRADPQQLRRLQLAAEAGNCWGLLFRGEHAAAEQSPAALRLAMQSQGDGDTRIDIIKARGGQPQSALHLDLNRPRTRSLPVQPSAAESFTTQHQPVPEGTQTQLLRRRQRPEGNRPQMDLPLDRPRRQRPQLVHPLS